MLTHRTRAPTAIEIEALYAHAWPSYQRHYLAINGHYARVYPGVEAGLQALRHAGLRLACLTNKPTSFALPLLRAKGLEGYFEQVFGGDSFDKKKPDPLPLLKTCEALQTAPARTLMVGDSSNDAQAARAAGCPVVLVTYGYNHGLPAQAVDTHIFRVANRTGIALGRDVLAVERALEDQVPAPFQGHAHHWLILHGRYVCMARKPSCRVCLIRDLCEFEEKIL